MRLPPPLKVPCTALAHLGMASSTAPDLDLQRKAADYARLRRRWWFARLMTGGIYTLAWLTLGWGVSLKQSALPYIVDDRVLIGIVGGVFGLGYYMTGLPISYCSGHVLSHYFRLSNQTRSSWISDQVKSLGLGALFTVVLLEVTYYLLRALPDLWWLVTGAILLLLSVILTNLGPVILFPIFYRVVPLGDEHADLSSRLTRLAEHAGTKVRGVYKFDMSRRTKAANAALMGLANTRRIVLSDTLISSFSSDEIETILGHELGHHVHKDIPLGIVVRSVITLGGLYLTSLSMGWGVTMLQLESVSDVAGIPWLVLVFGTYQIATMPLEYAYSRWRERSADKHALHLTGKGSAYASALVRLADQNLAEAYPERWVELMLYSHPALGKRIAMAEAYG